MVLYNISMVNLGASLIVKLLPSHSLVMAHGLGLQSFDNKP